MPAELETPPASWLRGTALEDRAQPLTEHLAELRRRLIVSLAAVAFAAALIFGRSGALLSWLAGPAGGLVFLAPTEAFYTRLRVSAFAGLLAALPVVLWQAWMFIARALEPRWRSGLLRLVPISYALFLLGAALALFVVAPAAMRFLLSYGAEGVRPMLSLGAYLDFVLGLALAFGGVFQLPLLVVALNRIGVLSRRQLQDYRRHVYFLCFLGAALLTPGPDIVSQIALAVPAVLLFELSLLACQ